MRLIFTVVPRLALLLLFAGIVYGIFRTIKSRKYRIAFLVGCSLVLLLFVTDAELDRRSTPGHIQRWFGGEIGTAQSAHDFFDDTRRNVNPQELQRWATTMIQQYAQNDSAVEFPLDKVPAYILSPKGFYLQEHIIGKDGAVYLGWGGALGRFGICIGPPIFKVASPQDENDTTNYTEWKPGIYFYIE